MLEMKPSEILEAAFSLIDAPEKWTVGSLAKGSNGEVVYCTSPKAVLFSPQGAVLRVFPGNDLPLVLATLNCLWQAIPSTHASHSLAELGIHAYNNLIHPDHAKLKTWFEQAIHLAKEYEYEAIRFAAEGVADPLPAGGLAAQILCDGRA